MVDRRTRVLITIDTEFSMGGYFRGKNRKPVPADRHIFCLINNKDYGINLIMDILEDYGLRGVFFVETEARYYFGEGELLNIIDNIVRRNHEVQLHTHPTFRFFLTKKRASDDMRRYSLEDQTVILDDALAFLSSHGVQGLLAYRPGNFNANHDTLRAVEKVGLKFTSFSNYTYRECYDMLSRAFKNDLFAIGKITETPVTCFKQFPIRKEWNSFQICAASYNEIKSALDFYHKQGMQLATLLTHSFEFVRPSDLQFSKITPKSTLIKRFKCIANYLAENSSRFQVVTYRELNDLITQSSLNLEKKEIELYKSPLLTTLHRYFFNMISKI